MSDDDDHDGGISNASSDDNEKMSSQFHHHESMPQAWSPTNEDGDDAAVDMTVTTAAMPLLTAHCCDCCRIMFVVPSVLFFPS